MADDLGYGDLGCFGQKNIKTPNLDRLASQGIRFTDFYSGSTVCAPSRCVLMTGYHTGHCRIRGNARQNLQPGDVTIAEVLKNAGYKTCLAGKWGIGHEGSEGVPTKQGFDQFYGYLHQGHAHNFYPTFLIHNEQRVLLKNVVPKEGKAGQGKASKKIEYSHDLITEFALNWVDQNSDQPFFLYWAPTIPHANNEAGREGMEVPEYGIYEEKSWPEPQKGHAAMITRMDRDIGRLVKLLEEKGIDKNTLILFTSDNGPHREGGNNPDFQNSNGALRGIKRSLHEGGIRVPTIAYWPSAIKSARESDHVACFQDVMPTVAEIAGVRDKCPSNIDGISFASTLTGKGTQRQHDYLYWAFYERGAGRALRKQNWKLVQQPIKQKPRLYDLSIDLGEKNNLADKYPEKVRQLIGLMEKADRPNKRWDLQKKMNANQ